MKRRIFTKFLAVSLATSLTAGFFNVVFAADPAKKDLHFGATVGYNADLIKYGIKPILEQQGYNVKLTEFTDYIRPNLALNEGSLDVNVFQHKPYLDAFKAKNNLDLSVLSLAPAGPMGLYAGKKSDLNAVTAHDTIIVPNDPSNQARALMLLDELGWIKLKSDIDPLKASEHDIADNIKKIKILALDAAQAPRARNSAAYAIINANFAISSGMKFSDSLYTESGNTFLNVVAVKTGDLTTQWAKDIKAAYQSDTFKTYTKTHYPDYKYPEDWQ